MTGFYEAAPGWPHAGRRAILGALDETSSSEPAPPANNVSLSLERAFRGFSRESVQVAIRTLTGLMTEAQEAAADAGARAERLGSENDRLAKEVETLRAERDRLGKELSEVGPEHGRLAKELEQYRGIEHSLAQTLALAEETARARQRQAEDEAQRILGEAHSNASEAARDAVADRDRALGEVARIREQLAAALSMLDAMLGR